MVNRNRSCSSWQQLSWLYCFNSKQRQLTAAKAKEKLLLVSAVPGQGNVCGTWQAWGNAIIYIYTWGNVGETDVNEVYTHTSQREVLQNLFVQWCEINVRVIYWSARYSQDARESVCPGAARASMQQVWRWGDGYLTTSTLQLQHFCWNILHKLHYSVLLEFDTVSNIIIESILILLKNDIYIAWFEYTV